MTQPKPNRFLQANIPTSLGDIINIKTHLDSVKSQYNSINLNYHYALWNGALDLNKQQEQQWRSLLKELGQLFFSEEPYTIGKNTYPFYDTEKLIRSFSIKPIKPYLPQLCKGEKLDIGEYVVLTTKVRSLDKLPFFQRSPEFWNALKTHKVVILGEREVEQRKEYLVPQLKNQVFGIYDQAIYNLRRELLVDRTIPALGNSVSTLKQIQQDCLIMRDAKAVICLGNGGNQVMAHAAGAKVINYREVYSWLGDEMFGKPINWQRFLGQIYELP